MKIDEHLRIPFAILGDARESFLLRRPTPIAIHVDEVMIEAAARPWLGVLEGFGIRVRLRSARADVPLHVALAAVGVQERVDEHDDVVEDLRRIGIAQQRTGGHHRRLGRRRFVPVYAIRQPGNRRSRFGDLRGARGRCRDRIGESDHVLSDRVQRGAILLRGDYSKHQRAVFICFTKLLYGNK